MWSNMQQVKNPALEPTSDKSSQSLKDGLPRFDSLEPQKQADSHTSEAAQEQKGSASQAF